MESNMKLQGSYKLYVIKREKAGLTNADVARISGISEAMLSYWKRGKRSPKLDKLSLIASALGCDVSELISYSDGEPIKAIPVNPAYVAELSDGVSVQIEVKPGDVEKRQANRLLTYYRLMSDRDKSLLLDMARRMAIVDDKEEGDPDEEP